MTTSKLTSKWWAENSHQTTVRWWINLIVTISGFQVSSANLLEAFKWSKWWNQSDVSQQWSLYDHLMFVNNNVMLLIRCLSTKRWWLSDVCQQWSLYDHLMFVNNDVMLMIRCLSTRRWWLSDVCQQWADDYLKI